MVKSFSADYILPVSSEPIKNGVVSVSESGEITGLFEKDDPAVKNLAIEHLEGIIVPGFVNSHCHLELSNLHKKFPKGKGLMSFIRSVIGNRDKETNVDEAMERADRTMYENGIVAVGDISNRDVSIALKQKSPIHYHTFVEVLGFDPEKAKDIFEAGLAIRNKIGEDASIVPHAAYSVSKELLRSITTCCKDGTNLISIHNQETEEENKFYRYKTGGFIDFYKELKLDISFFKPQARNSLQSILPLLPSNQRIMLVHNTYTSLKDIYFIRRFGRDITWCFCPNANLYIESRLPKVEMFLINDLSITIGTDSLASNDELCILSELKTLFRKFPQIPFTKTLGWATLNGARFFNIDKRFGSIEIGKSPGLNLISKVKGLELTTDSEVTRLI